MGGAVSATGLSADPAQYRIRLEEQPDEAIDAWSAELMRDLSIRIGVIKVLASFRTSSGLNEAGLERVFAAGGGAPVTFGRTVDGQLMVPAISLHHLVSGLRAQLPDARARLVTYLTDNFHEIVFL